MNENNQNNVNNVNNMNNDEINPSTDINTNTDTNANIVGNIETDSTQDSPQPSTATATAPGTVEVAARGELWTVKFSRMATSLYHHGAPVPVVSTYNIFVLSSASSYTLSVFLSIY